MRLLTKTLIATALLAAGFAGNASAATATGNFNVQITITESCLFSTTPSGLDFGTKARSSAGNVDLNGNLVVNCSLGTPFRIGLGAGASSGATVTTRKMTGTGGTINYNLFRETGRTTNWGNTDTVDTVPSVGTGVDQTLTVYGRVAGGANVNVAAGLYTDTVVATIYY